MKRSMICAVLLALAAVAVARPTSPAPADLLKSLPPGDLVMTINVDALVNKGVAAWFSGDADTARRVEDRFAKARTETGIDLHKVRDVAISMQLGETSSADFAAVLTGSFDPAQVAAALKASKGGAGARTETYGGATIQSFSARIDAPGAPVGTQDLAVSILDPETMLVGSVASVRAAIDARAGRGPSVTANTELMAAYEEAGTTGVGRFAMKMPAEMIKAELAKDPSNVALQNFALVRTIFGSLDVGTGAALRATARTIGASEAKSVSTSLVALKDLARLFAGGNAALSDLVDRAAVTTQGSDVVLTIDVPSALVPAIYKSFQRPEAPKPMAAVQRP